MTFIMTINSQYTQALPQINFTGKQIYEKQQSFLQQ